MKFLILLCIFFNLSFPKILFAKSSCKLSGKQVLLKGKHDVNINFQKIYEKIDDKLSSFIANHKKEYCPANCIQENNFKINVSSVPKYTEKNSCKDTSEKYTFKKHFKSMLTNDKIQNMKSASKSLNLWIKQTFINPYIPFKKKNVSSEHENLLHSACPPCSFYLNYDYTFTKSNAIDSNFLVKCGDRKIIHFLKSNFETTFKLTNNWKCKDKKL